MYPVETLKAWLRRDELVNDDVKRLVFFYIELCVWRIVSDFYCKS